MERAENMKANIDYSKVKLLFPRWRCWPTGIFL